MLSFRVIVVVDGERTIQVVESFERVPDPGEVIQLPGTEPVTVRHVIEAPAARVGGRRARLGELKSHALGALVLARSIGGRRQQGVVERKEGQCPHVA